MRLIIFVLFLQIISISRIYSQNNGLLKNETITTYWGSNQKQVRSVGTYQTSGYSNIGAKTGKWIHFYKNGNLQVESNYFLGQLNGEYKSYYLNGKLKFRTFYTLGKIDSIFEAFYQDGTLAEKGESSEEQPTLSNRNLLIFTAMVDAWRSELSQKEG